MREEAERGEDEEGSAGRSREMTEAMVHRRKVGEAILMDDVDENFRISRQE